MAFDVARMALTKASVNMKKQYDKKVHQIPYKAGERCMLKNHTKAPKGTKKFRRKYQGPYWILDKIGSVNFRIQKDENTSADVVHHNRMRRYNIPDPIPVPQWVKKSSIYGVKFDILWPIIDEDTTQATGNKDTKVNTGNPTNQEPTVEKPTLAKKSKVKKLIKRKKVNLTRKLRKDTQTTIPNTTWPTHTTNPANNPIKPEAAAAEPTIPVRTRYGRLIKRPDRYKDSAG